MILSNLLPGLREVRAPLAAGFLWITVAWLELDNHVSKHTTTSGTVNALSQLRNNVGVGATAAAVTFVAYLLGALWQPISVWVAEKLWLLRSKVLERATKGVDVLGSWRFGDDLPPSVQYFVAQDGWGGTNR